MQSPSAGLLIDFVEASNALEDFWRSDYGRQSGELVFTQHLAAAQMVASCRILDPCDIHRVVMAGMLTRGEMPGAPRRCGVQVDGMLCIDARYVPAGLDMIRQTIVAGPPRGATAEVFAWQVHHLLEFIHPFSDGNGRVGRLLLNGLRQRHGLPWLVIGPAHDEAYTKAIRDWQARYAATIAAALRRAA